MKCADIDIEAILFAGAESSVSVAYLRLPKPKTERRNDNLRAAFEKFACPLNGSMFRNIDLKLNIKY